MINSFSGTIYSGAVQLDEQVDLADQCRVLVTIVPIDQNRDCWQRALAELDQLRRSNPLQANGLQFSREQLHDRN